MLSHVVFALIYLILVVNSTVSSHIETGSPTETSISSINPMCHLEVSHKIVKRKWHKHDDEDEDDEEDEEEKDDEGDKDDEDKDCDDDDGDEDDEDDEDGDEDGDDEDDDDDDDEEDDDDGRLHSTAIPCRFLTNFTRA